MVCVVGFMLRGGDVSGRREEEKCGGEWMSVVDRSKEDCNYVLLCNVIF